MMRSWLPAAVTAGVLALAGCGQSASGGVTRAAAQHTLAPVALGHAVRLTDSDGHSGRLTVSGIDTHPGISGDQTAQHGSRVLGINVTFKAISGDPGYEAEPIVIGSNHKRYDARSNSSPPDPTDITVAIPKGVRVACVRDTIDDSTKIAQWRVGAGGCT